MVRRLVEHEQVGLHDQQPREVRAHDPAAAHLARGAVEVGLAEGEAAEDALGFRLELVAAELRVLAERVVGLLGIGRASARTIGEDAHELAVLRRDGAREFKDGLVAGGGGFLRQVAERGVLVEDDAAGVGLAGAEDDGEQRRLARAVRADQRDALAEVDAQRHLFKEGACAKAFADIGQGKHKRPSVLREGGRREQAHGSMDFLCPCLGASVKKN